MRHTRALRWLAEGSVFVGLVIAATAATTATESVTTCGARAVWRTGGLLAAMTVRDSTVYAAVGPQVVVSDRNGTGRPMIKSFGSAVRDLAVDEPFVYVVTARGELVVWDRLRDALTSFAREGRDYFAVRIFGDYLYVLDTVGGDLFVMSGSASGNLAETGRISLPGGPFSDIEISDEEVYLLGNGLTRLILEPHHAPAPEIGWSALGGKIVRDIMVLNDTVVVAAGNDLLVAQRTSSNEVPSFRPWYSATRAVTAIEENGDTIYVAVAETGVLLLRRVGAELELVELQASTYPVALALVDGRILYVGDSYEGIRRVTRQEGSRLLPLVPIMAGYDIVRTGHDLLVSSLLGGLIIGQEEGQDWQRVPTRGAARSAAIDGNRIVVATMASGVQLFERGPLPHMISQVGYIETPGVAIDVIMQGQYVYVADMSGGLRIIDLHDWPVAREVFAVDVGTAYNIEIDGDEVFVAGGASGVWRLDVTEPTRPIVEKFSDFRAALSVRVAPKSILVGSSDGTVVELERISGRRVRTRAFKGPIWAIDTDDMGRVYLALGYEGFAILEDEAETWRLVTRFSGPAAWSILPPDGDDNTVVTGDSIEGLASYKLNRPCKLLVPVARVTGWSTRQ